ncbi:MAG: hypothetical protein AB1689_01880 [Thermodesulfobacteriota bacterium]
MVSLHDEDGNVRAVVAVSARGDPYLVLSHPGQLVGAEARLSDDGAAVLVLSHRETEGRSELGVDAGGNPVLAMSDRHGNLAFGKP